MSEKKKTFGRGVLMCINLCKIRDTIEKTADTEVEMRR